MVCGAVQIIQMQPAEGTSGESSICATTSAGCFIGDSQMKSCSRCNETKPLSEFYKDRSKKDGLTGFCKSCMKTHQRTYRQTERGGAVHLKSVLKYQQTPKGKAKIAKYLKSPRGKAVHRKAAAKRKTLHPNQIKARHAVSHAIEAGRLPRPDCFPCYFCQKTSQEYHHHKGYEPEHWLDVVPACIPCHRRKEVIYEQAENA